MENEIEKYFDRLWPICRSITGNGVRETLKILQELIPLQLAEVPTGTKVFDWEIPKEWNIRDAFVITPAGKKICDLKINNLHVVNYSVPVDMEISFDELKTHLHFIEAMPDAVPYICSYYKENWGFCISYNEFCNLPKEGLYKVVIDSDLSPGNLTYGDFLLKGESSKEILFSTYVCHPSMANNELSGPLVTAFLYKKISQIKNRKYSYRFVFAPETIGIIAYLQKYGQHLLQNLHAGYVITCCGDSGPYVFKRSKRGNSDADKIAEHVLKFSSEKYSVMDFAVGGSDERQYCSPGFNLPVASLTRSMYQRYKEYHTSLDNKSFISFSSMKETIEMYFSFVKALEINNRYINQVEYCEPFMSRHDLYPTSVDLQTPRNYIHNMMHLLAFADGTIDLIDIAERRNCSISEFEKIVETLFEKNIITVK